jgi:antitoxin CptB
LSEDPQLTGEVRVKRLRWLCRRGMRELEILLEGFLLREEAELSDGNWPAFEALLACEDDQLWDWFQGKAEPDEPALRELVAAIR